MLAVRRFVATVSGKVPLRTVLIVPFVLQIIAIVGLTGYLSYLAGKQAIEDLVSQLQDEVSDRITDKLTTYLEAPKTINQINADAIRLGLLDLNHVQSLDRYLWRQIKEFDSLTFVAIATESGNYIGIGRRSEYELRLGIIDRLLDGTTRTWALGSQGNRATARETYPNFDPRTRPWYVAAVNKGRSNWSDIYPARDTHQLLLPISQPVYGLEGQLLGVVTSTLTPSSLSGFLQNLKVGDTGQTFIMEQNGLLVATSTEESPTRRSNQGVEERLLAVYSGNEVTRAIARHLDEEFENLAAIQDHYRFEYQIGGDRYFVQVKPLHSLDEQSLREARDLNWLVVVVVPESEFIGKIQANTRNTAWLCLAALAVAIVISIVTSRWITKPLFELSQASESLSQGNWEQQVHARGSIELKTLGRAFNHMAHQLKLSHEQLAEYSKGLEKLVAERTEALRQSEEKFSMAFRFSPEPIAIATLVDGKIIEANDSYFKRTGYSQAEVIGKSAKDLNLWVNLDDAQTVARALNEDGFIHNLEIDYRKKTGEIGTVLLSAEVIELNGQRCTLYVNSDISDRIASEMALKTLNQELENRVQERTAELQSANEQLRTLEANLRQQLNVFLNAVSHDLRNPVMGTSIVLKNLCQQPGEAIAIPRDILDRMLQSNERQLSLIDSLIETHAVEVWGINLNCQSVLLHDLVQSAIADLQPLIEREHATLTNLIAPSLPPVKVDPLQMSRVYQNLIANALKHNPLGLKIVLNAQHEGSWMRCTVDDNGIGISPDQQHKLFDLYFQGRQKRRSVGLGLGLYLCQQIVHAHGGEIGVESQPQQGARFWFTLPLG